MEMHDTGDFAVQSLGTARVFGYHGNTPDMRHDALEEMAWEQVFYAEDHNRGPSARRDLQVCGIVGKQCDWCDAQAVGYIRIPGCNCTPGGCREWVCAKDAEIC